MKKVLDNTAVSAFSKEIQSLDLFPILCSRYEVIISEDVDHECTKIKHQRVNEFRRMAKKYSPSDSRYVNACQYLKQRYSWIGAGEISAIVSSVLLTMDGFDNYVITDDRKARDLIRKIHKDASFRKIIGKEICEIKSSGTVGLVLRFRDCGLITKKICMDIADDLESSTFRITPALLELLRN